MANEDRLEDFEHKRADLTASLLHWDLRLDEQAMLSARVHSRLASDVRVSEVAAERCRGYRDDYHHKLDGGDYVGILCKIEGHEVCRNEDGEVELHPGDIAIWRNSATLEFDAEDWNRKIIMIVPETRFAAIVREPLTRPVWVVPNNSGLGPLVASFMTALAHNLQKMDDLATESAVDMALDLVGSAINGRPGEVGGGKRSNLCDRIMRYIDRHLEDSNLSPAAIAAAHGISTRYLHLVFANREETVAGWIRERRLLRCREEIELARRGMSLTEIAYCWGFSDGPHFSRMFKRRFGMSPKAWRNMHKPRTVVARAAGA